MSGEDEAAGFMPIMEDENKEKEHFYTFDNIINIPLLYNTEFFLSTDDEKTKENNKKKCDSESEKNKKESDTDTDTDIEDNPKSNQRNHKKVSLLQFIEELKNDSLSDVYYKEWYN